jgi:dTDP-4-dehydrorhamnose reductase
MAGSKVLVTGFNGLLGNRLCQELLSQKFDCFGLALDPLPIKSVKAAKVDITNFKRINSLIQRIRPQIIFHLAALVNVDSCQESPALAKKINTNATANLAQIAKEVGALLVYISTDFVFDGAKGGYQESDKTGPINIYAQTKLAGEGEIEKSDAKHLIVRTSIYGWNKLPKNSFSEAVIKKLEANQEFTPFVDQYFTPLYTGTLARLILALIKKNAQGLYHLSSDERVSKMDFARLVARVFGLNQKLLKPKRAQDIKFVGPRPKDVSLKNQKAKKALGLTKISLLDDLKLMKKERGFYEKS